MGRLVAMYKPFLALLVVCCLLLVPHTVHADLVLAPDNEFYTRHASQIIYLGRSFIANADSGNVAVKEAPGAKKDIATIQNDTVVFMQYSCLYDGDFWGFTYEYAGWVNLGQMLVLYDYVAFEEEHFDDLYLYHGDYAEIKETRSAVAWPWPGADSYIWTYVDLDAENFRTAYAYKDEDGREWGFVTYLYGDRNIWVCLSDPLKKDMPVFNPAPEPGVWESETVHVDIKKYERENGFRSIVVIAVLVVALVAGTAVLIGVVWKPKKAVR